MKYTIERVRLGDEKTLAYIQTESWKAAFKDILSPDVLEKCTNLGKATMMYRRLLEQNIGNGYLLKVEDKPHCIAWWDSTREKDMPGYAELICIHSLPDQWRSGYGSKMMDTVLHDISVAGYTKVMLWVFEENTRARQFYERHGFTTEGKSKPNIEPIEICYEKQLIYLKPMSYEMYHKFFKEYENDMDLYLDKKDYYTYRYDKENVDRYIQKQVDLKRIPFAIMYGDEIVGELKLYNIETHTSAALGITMKNKEYKDRGFGTQAEKMAIDYVFHELDIPVLYADSILTNTRSQHVLEKVGFQLINQDEKRKHYKIVRSRREGI